MLVGASVSEPPSSDANGDFLLLGRAQRAPHLWIKRKFVYLFICIYIWYVRIPYIYSALFVRDAIFPHVVMSKDIAKLVTFEKPERSGMFDSLMESEERRRKG